MKEPISIKEILAIVIRKGVAVIAVTLAFAILLGGLQGLKTFKASRQSSNTAEAVALRNEEKLSEYEAQAGVVNSQIANMQHKIDMQQQYNEESLLMQLDPYSKYESHVAMAITELEENAFQQFYKLQTTPVDYIVSKILQQYVVYWNNLDLAERLQGTAFEGVPEKFVREIVSVSKGDGGTLYIKASAATEADAAVLCQRVEEAILDSYNTICDATYAHGLTVISSGTKQMVDYDLDKKQITNQENLDLEKLKKPGVESVITKTDVLKTAIKWAVIGGIVGFVMACGCVWLLYIVKDGVETSAQASAILAAPYFGSAAGKKGLFDRFADWFVGERSWKDKDQAIAYITENLKSHLSAGDAVALVSSGAAKEDDACIAAVVKSMQDQGYTVRFADEAGRNPAAIAAVRESEYVILAERLGKTSRGAMICVQELAQQLDAKILGFITI